MLRHDRVQGFYREVSGLWFFLRPEVADGFQTVRCEPWSEPSSARLSLPVRELAKRQFGPEAATGWDHVEPPKLDLLALVQAGRRENWNWDVLRQGFPQLSQENNGWAFEDFFGALLQCLGATNTILRLTRTERGRAQAEFDVLTSTGHKLVIFDLKLTKEDDVRSEGVNTQLSRLGQDRRLLGGLGAEAVAIRPTWPQDSSLPAMARGHQLTLWTQGELPGLLPALRKLLDLPPAAPGSLAEVVEKEFLDAVQNGERLFSSPQLPVLSSESRPADLPVEPSIGWWNSTGYIEDCSRLRRRWCVIDLGPMFFVGLRCEPGEDRRKALQSAIGPLADWSTAILVPSKSGQAIKAVLRPSQHTTREQLRDHLRDLVKSKLGGGSTT
jgi:hypothetical protein